MDIEEYQKYINIICGDHWFFNTRFEGDLQYLKLFSKRCKRYADVNAVPDKTNKLWIVWSNMKPMLCKDDPDYYREVMYFTAVMSKKIDDYSQTNMLDGDQTVGRIFYELDEITFCQYDLLNI